MSIRAHRCMDRRMQCRTPGRAVRPFAAPANPSASGPTGRGRRACVLVLAAGLSGLLCGCERARQDMYDQPRYKTFAAGALWEDGATARTAPDGVQPRARGAYADSSGGRLGVAAVVRDIAAEQAQSNPYPVDQPLLQRGRNRYTIYCVPCHSPVGDGDGLVVRRGFPAPPSFHQARLRDAPDRHLYDVITQGYGVMAPYADRIEPADRWAIVAFIRALQLSQYAAADRLPPAQRVRLQKVDGDSVPDRMPPAEAAAGLARGAQ